MKISLTSPETWMPLDADRTVRVSLRNLMQRDRPNATAEELAHLSKNGSQALRGFSILECLTAIDLVRLGWSGPLGWRILPAVATLVRRYGAIAVEYALVHWHEHIPIDDAAACLANFGGPSSEVLESVASDISADIGWAPPEASQCP